MIEFDINTNMDIDINDLPEPYNQMAMVIGIENTLKLAKAFEKQYIYFKSLDFIISEQKRKYIIKNFKGNNHKELARNTGYSIQTIYRVLKNNKK